MITQDKIPEDLRKILENADFPSTENPFINLPHPIIGDIKDHERVHSTSIEKILRELNSPQDSGLLDDDTSHQIEEIIERHYLLLRA